jgi:hypothetical protein
MSAPEATRARGAMPDVPAPGPQSVKTLFYNEFWIFTSAAQPPRAVATDRSLRWSSQSLKPGDELRLTVEPLRSGAPGGGWHARNTTFKDGTPIVMNHER